VQPGGTVEEIFLLSVRALLWLVLLAGLIFMGVQQIFDKNPTFGAELFDYVGLFLWGIGSDVASKTLVSLSISKPS